MLIDANNLFTFFDYFYNKIYDCAGLKISRSPSNIKCTDAFLALIKKEFGETLGKEFLYTYCLFQFNYWDRLELKSTESYNNRIQLSFIFGKKAFERYLKRDNNYDWQLSSLPVIKKYGLRKIDLIEQLSTKHKIAVKKGIDTEAPFKLPFFNTLEGFNTCKDYSTLFNHKSSICNECLFKDDCKVLLKKTYPTLYMDRGYK